MLLGLKGYLLWETEMVVFETHFFFIEKSCFVLSEEYENICCANFQQRSFLATFTMDVFLIRFSLWEIHIFKKIAGGDDVIFMNSCQDLDFLGVVFTSPEPLIMWSQETKFVDGGIILKCILLRNRSGLKLLFLAKICLLFEPLCGWGCITPQINQKSWATLMVSLRHTLFKTESYYNDLFLTENSYFWPISYLLNCLL